MDLSQFAGEDYADVTIAGVVYRVGELTLAEWAPVQAWIKATVPGPLSCLASPDFRRLPPEVKREVLGEAMDRDRLSWPPRIGSRKWTLALDHPGGHAVLLLAILGKHRPGLGVEECQAIADLATFDEIVAAYAAAMGMLGPKSPAPARTTTGATTTTTTGAGATSPTTSATSPSSSSRRRAGRRRTSSA